MPNWMLVDELSEYGLCTEAELWQITGYSVSNLDELDAVHKRQAYERYTMISGVLSFIGEEKQRAMLIDRIAAYYKVSKQTIRRHLCQYLAFQSVVTLATKPTDEEK